MPDSDIGSNTPALGHTGKAGSASSAWDLGTTLALGLEGMAGSGGSAWGFGKIMALSQAGKAGAVLLAGGGHAGKAGAMPFDDGGTQEQRGHEFKAGGVAFDRPLNTTDGCDEEASGATRRHRIRKNRRQIIRN